MKVKMNDDGTATLSEEEYNRLTNINDKYWLLISKKQTADTLQEEYSRTKGAPTISPCAADLDDDPVHPTHYTSLDPRVKVTCLEAMRAAFGTEAVKDGLLQNAFEYIWRSSSKGGNQDIQKAINELNIFIELGGYE